MAASTWIERFLYASLPGERTISLTDSGGGPVSFTIATTATVTNALADLEAQANADATLAGTYTFTLDATGAGVTLACGETFTVSFSESMHKALGFGSTSYSGSASYSSDVVARAWMRIHFERDAYGVAERVSLREWRHGRHDAMVHHYARTAECRFWAASADYDVARESGLFDGKLRLHPSSSSNAYGFADLDGYHDLNPYEHQRLGTTGQDEGYVHIELMAVVA